MKNVIQIVKPTSNSAIEIPQEGYEIITVSKNSDSLKTDPILWQTLNDITKKEIDIENKYNNLKIELQATERESTDRIIQLVAIFIAFFTFISIEMQIFKSILNWNLASALSCILLGSVVFFVTVINLFFGQEENSINLKQIIIGTISIILIVTGVWLIYNSKYHNKDYIFKNELDNYYTKQEFNKQTSIENQKIQKIFDCTKYSDGFWNYKECIE